MLRCDELPCLEEEAVPLSSIEPTLQYIRNQDCQGKEPKLDDESPDELSSIVASTIDAVPSGSTPSLETGHGLHEYNTFIMQLIYSDILSTCTRLQLPEDPAQWSAAHVNLWTKETLQLRGLSTSIATAHTGVNLYCMTLDDFRNNFGSYGDILKSCFDLWVQAVYHCKNDSAQTNRPRGPSTGEHCAGKIGTGSTPCSFSQSVQHWQQAYQDSDDSVDLSDAPLAGSSTIHLWQFIKHMLEHPLDSSHCVRWLSKSQGIFKIENSALLAKLWGRRKNRPAMNYDKLSRSLRQYYKKGILQKTPRSQRLIYQFCPPYRY